MSDHRNIAKLLKKDEMLEGVDVSFDKELGRGSFATVYKAEWLGLPCVVKVFHPIIFPKHPAETWKQLGREIELLQKIRHPNIVQLLGFVSDPTTSTPSIVMELLDKNLTKLLEQYGVLSFDLQVGILHDVAVGLSFLHGQKEPIIHRDLSSNNILLTIHLVAKLSDLGLAKHIKSPELQVGSFAGFGTQDYMPPEVLGQKPPQISPKTDIFSFGVVTLQVATGKTPEVKGIINLEAEVVRRKHHIDQLEKNSPFQQVIVHCLNKSSHRPSAIELCKQFKRLEGTRKSTLDLTKQLKDKEINLQKVTETQENMQEQFESLRMQFAEEKNDLRSIIKELQQDKTALHEHSFNQKATYERNVALEKEKQQLLDDENTLLKNRISNFAELQPTGAMKLLVEQNVKLANLLENTSNGLEECKNVMQKLFSGNTASNIDRILKQSRDDRDSVTIQLKNTEKEFSQLCELAKKGSTSESCIMSTSLASNYTPQYDRRNTSSFSKYTEAPPLVAGQKTGIDLQKLHAIEDMVTQGKIKDLEKQLQSKEEEKIGIKRTMERTNVVLTNRLRRLEDQLKAMPNSTGSSNEAMMVEEIRKLNMRIAELETAEHMMKGSSTGQRHYHQQIQELEQRNSELKLQVANLEEINRMQQGEALEESKKEIEQNRAVIAQLQNQMQEDHNHIIRYKEDAHQKQTDLLEESRAAMIKSMELTEENAKLHEQNFNLSEDLKSVTAKLQQGGGGGVVVNDEKVATLKREIDQLKIQLDKATDQSTLDAINNKMTKYKGERDDARAQVQQLQEQLHTQGGGGERELASNAVRYREERNTLQAEVTKLNNIIAQMASAKAAQPGFGSYTRQFSSDDPSSPTGDVLASLSNHSVTSDVPPAQYSATRDTEMVSHVVPPPTNQNYQSKLPAKGPQGRKIPTAASSISSTGSAVKKPVKRSSKAAIKYVTTSTSGEKGQVWCEPVTSVSIGQRVVVMRSNGEECGTVRATGVIIGSKAGYVGIEMDLPSGGFDGEVKGVRHFKCKPKHAVFVAIQNIQKIVE